MGQWISKSVEAARKLMKNNKQVNSEP